MPPKKAAAKKATAKKSISSQDTILESETSNTTATTNLIETSPQQIPSLARYGTSIETGLLLRGQSFVNEYMGKAASPPSSPRVGAFTRDPTMIKAPDQPLIPAALSDDKKYTFVFDLDETLVYARDDNLYARAYTKKLLKSLNEFGEIIVWTAGSKNYAKAVVKEINVDNVIKHLIYRDKSWFNSANYTKDLTKLGRDKDYVLIVENTPGCVELNPENGIIVSDFEGGEMSDATLKHLIAMVQEMVTTDLPVPKYLSQSQYVTKQNVKSSGKTIQIYFLSEKGAGAAKKVVKRNRDLGAKVEEEATETKPVAEEEEDTTSAAKKRATTATKKKAAPKKSKK
eukprot:PhF_6_TR14111/c0_g1_i1/m.22546/K15731/CTDSP; carboxy-terminal domain RNA polymerase II polypeptide A small phosphatase